MAEKKKRAEERSVPRLNREEIIKRVMEKYGYRRWEVEFAADHLLGVEHPQGAPVKKDKPKEEEEE